MMATENVRAPSRTLGGGMSSSTSTATSGHYASGGPTSLAPLPPLEPGTRSSQSSFLQPSFGAGRRGSTDPLLHASLAAHASQNHYAANASSHGVGGSTTAAGAGSSYAHPGSAADQDPLSELYSTRRRSSINFNESALHSHSPHHSPRDTSFGARIAPALLASASTKPLGPAPPLPTERRFSSSTASGWYAGAPLDGSRPDEFAYHESWDRSRLPHMPPQASAGGAPGATPVISAPMGNGGSFSRRHSLAMSVDSSNSSTGSISGAAGTGAGGGPVRRASASLAPPDSAKRDTPYSRSPELRVSHKIAERKRRKEMKELFDDLRERLPADRGPKTSKWEILSKAVDHINQLTTERDDLLREVQALRRESGAGEAEKNPTRGPRT